MSGEGREVKRRKLAKFYRIMSGICNLKELNPPSSREDSDQLEKNTLAALDAVPLKSMRKFANRSQRFMDACDRGLVNGRQLEAWAARKYRGHRDHARAGQ
jgi:hypothetical protein